MVKTGHINDPAAIAAIRQHGIDWLFIVGWSQIAGEEALRRLPRRGALGMHPTLLPEGRGRAAIPWAILKGLSRTGVTLFPTRRRGGTVAAIAAQVEIPLATDETATSLYHRVNEGPSCVDSSGPSRTGSPMLFLSRRRTRRARANWPGRTPSRRADQWFDDSRGGLSVWCAR